MASSWSSIMRQGMHCQSSSTAPQASVPGLSHPLPARLHARPWVHSTGLQRRTHITRQAGDMSLDQAQPIEPVEPVKEYPRRTVSDPYRRLGIEETAEFDEIESARAYLISEYGAHRPSREAIEMAYDKILKERYESRKKTGFRPVDKKTGKRAGGKEETLKERIQKSIDYEVTRNKIVNEVVVYGLMIAATFADDVGGALAFTAVLVSLVMSTYKVYKKRSTRNPDGPYFLDTPVPGALGQTLLGMFGGIFLGSMLAKAGVIGASIAGSFSIALGLLFNFAAVTFLK